MPNKSAAASHVLDRVLVLEMVRVTEAAAIAASALIGRGDEKAADAAAVEAMRRAFDNLYIDGTVVIGEGERDEAPMLYIGEKVGARREDPGAPRIDIALDPLEGTTITAKAGANALAVLAIAEQGCLLNAPDVYMEKLAIKAAWRGRSSTQTMSWSGLTPLALATASTFSRGLFARSITPGG